MPRPASSSPAEHAALAGVAARRSQRQALEIEDLYAALNWALAHPEVAPEPYAAAAKAQPIVNAGWLAEREDEYAVQADAANLVIDDPFIPVVAWDAYAPFAAALGRSTLAGRKLITDALVLHYRLPRLWAATVGGRVEVWRARRIAQAVRMRPEDVAAYVDEVITPQADSIGSARLDALIDEAMLRLHAEERELQLADARESWGLHLSEEAVGVHNGVFAHVGQLAICGDVKDLTAFTATASRIARVLGLQARAAGDVVESLDVRKARAIGILADPSVALALLEGDLTARTAGPELVVHLSRDALTGADPVANAEGPLRARLAQEVAEWAGRSVSVKVLPVIDLTSPASSASPEVTASMARRAQLRVPTCVFPFCDRASRHCDVDHVVASGIGGPSTDANLVPLCRHHHRLKTHAGWSYTQIEEGVWLWRDPHGRRYLREGSHTRDLTPTPSPGPPASVGLVKPPEPPWPERPPPF